MDLRTFLRVLRRRAGLLLATIALVALVAVVASSVRADAYKASATLRARTTGAVADGTVRTDSVEYLDRLRSTYADLVDESSFRQALARELETDAAPDPFVNVSTYSELFDVGVETGDEELAAPAADAAAALLIATIREQDQEDLRRGEEQFLLEEQRLREEIDGLQAALTNLDAAPADDSEVAQEAAQLRSELDVRVAAASEHSAEYATWRRQQVDRARTLSIVNPAAEVDPVGPSTAAVVGAGLLAGLIAGLGVALVAENLSGEVEAPGGVATLLGAPVLGALAADAPARGGWNPTSSARAPGGLEAAALRLAEDTSDDVWVVLPDSAATGRSAALGLGATMAQLGRRAAVLLCGDEASHQPGDTDVIDVLSGPGPMSSQLVSSPTREGQVAVFILRHPRSIRAGSVTPPIVEKAIVLIRERHDVVVVRAPAISSGLEWAVFVSVVPAVVVALQGERASREAVVALREQIEGVGGRVGGVLHVRHRRFHRTKNES